MLQIDVVLASGEPLKAEEIKDEANDAVAYDDDEDQDDDEDDDVGFQDYVGDVKAKLEKNNLKYSQTDELKDGQNFCSLLDQFKKENGIDDEDQAYLKGKRVVILYDRRKSQGEAKSDVFLYEPPPGLSHENITLFMSIVLD